MEEKDEKGFEVRDRRNVSPDGLDEEARSGDARRDDARRMKEEKAKENFEKASAADRQESFPLPQVTFSTFVFSLSSSALVHLGEIPDPGSQRVETDLPLAKQIIDTLGMLDEKTRGNLSSDEEHLLKSVLYDLRVRFVQKSGAKRS